MQTSIRWQIPLSALLTAIPHPFLASWTLGMFKWHVALYPVYMTKPPKSLFLQALRSSSAWELVRSWVAHLQDHLSADGGRSFPGPFCSTDTLKRPSVQSHSHPPAPIRESQEQHGMLTWTRHSWTWHQPSWNCYLQIPSSVWSHVILRFKSNVLLPKDTKRRNWAIYKVIWKGCSRLFHKNCQNGCARFHSHQQQRNSCCLTVSWP